MHRYTRRILPLSAAVVLTVAAGLSTWQGSELEAAADSPQGRLAQHLGLAPERLQHLQVAEETLLDGSRLTTLKAIDRDTSAIVGASFLGGRTVDRRQAIAAAGAAWRAVNGAITPGLLPQLQALREDERIGIDIWYRFDPPEQAQDKGPPLRAADAGAPPELLAQLAQMREAEAAAIAWSATRSDDKSMPDTALAPGAAAIGTPAATAVAPEVEKPGSPVAVVIPDDRAEASRIALAEAAERELQRQQALMAAMAPARSRVLARLQNAGITATYSSDLVPTLSVEVDRATAFALSRWPEIDALYATPTREGVALGTARPALNANLTQDVGYTGTGVTVSVSEWGRVFGENPFLTVNSYCRPGEPGDGHPTAVAGFVASTHATHRGIAPGATLVSANCEGTAELIDWGAANARVLNHSIWSESGGSANFNSHDRRIDYIARFLFDTPVMASGNAGNGCALQGGYLTDFVTSPGKGYNAITVGNVNDGNTVPWGNDTMANCSSFGNPTGDGAGGGHEKPELSAYGTALTSTTVSTVAANAVGGVGSGTSYASPMVAGMAANLIQADSALNARPEAIKPILMASALNNIEGASRLSDVDGAGGMVATSAIAIVERGHVDYRQLTGAASLPITLYALAKQGERVRFAIHWQSNPNATYTSDPLPADIDLRAFRGDGTTLVAASTSVNNPFEIVEFTAPETDLYVFRIELWGSWSGGSTYFGAGWWRGVDRLSNGYWQTMGSEPAPLGDHFELRPTEATPSNYWHGVALRPNSADYDLQLFNDGWFEDPIDRTQLAASTYGGSAVDYILVDGNHWSSAAREYYRAYRFSGSGAYQLSAAKHGSLIGLNDGGLFGPYTLNSIQSLFVADVNFGAASMRKIRLVPAIGSNDDLGLALYRSSAADSATWRRSRAQSVASSDSGGVGAGERLRYTHDGTSSDYLAVAVFNKTYNSSTEFYLEVTPSAIFTDGFDGD